MNKKYPKKVILCILDGWGLAEAGAHNAVSMSKTPNYNDILQKNPHCLLNASGESVGLPAGQMGNSEVGHMNIGAGRVVDQILRRIDRALLDETPDTLEAWQQNLQQLQASGGRLHLFGLISDGRVHGCHRHLIALAQSAIAAGITVCIHAVADGRDSSPQGLPAYLSEVIEAVPEAKICTLIGRYYALDRDNRWERTEKAWRLLQLGDGTQVQDWREAVQEYYNQDLSDEFLPATLLDADYTGIQPEDIFVSCNYRSDRIRQIVYALRDEHFAEFSRTENTTRVPILSMVHYGTELTDVLFARAVIHGTLGEAVASAGLSQVRIAETEKFPHVTYFFNAGREEAHPKEERRLIPSPKVASYDLAPEMSAQGITEAVLEAMQEQHPLIIVNYANPDMVGHTGHIPATITAVETVDHALGEVIPAAETHGYSLLVTADHGNAEVMWNPETNMPHTAHTTNPVRFIACNSPITELQDGVLGDIAPTILSLLDCKQPDAMSGQSLSKHCIKT